LIKELKRKKMMEEELQRERNAINEAEPVSATSTTTVATEDSKSGALPKKEEMNDEKEKTNKTTSEEEEEMKKTKEEEGTEECPICLENLPKFANEFVRWTCCGNGMHKHCDKDLASMKMDGTCPLCRAKTPSSKKEMVKYLHPWVKKKKAWAQCSMGQCYRDGEGVKQSYKMAKILYELAAQQGDASAMTDLGFLYENGKGVEQSYEKAFEYYEQAAHLGFADAQYNLGCMYAKGEGVAVDYAKAKVWWAQAGAQGHEDAIHNLALLEQRMN